MKETPICPYCGCEDTERIDNRPTITGELVSGYHCDDCDRLFDEEDIEREELRHQLSLILMDTDGYNQMECDIWELGSDEAMGLSSIEMLRCDRIFQIPGDGTIWLHLTDTDPEEYYNIDNFCTEDIRHIIDELSK